MKFKRVIFYLSIILGGIGFVSRGLKKQPRLRWCRIIIGVVLGLAFIGGLAISQVLGKADSYFFQEIDGCAVVFGAAVWRDSQPSWALSDRVQAGIELYEKDQVACLIMSGGASRFGDHETDVMTRLALEAGVPAADISQDYYGNNTLATMNNLPTDIDSFVFVSNDFHLARIGLMAQKKGVKDFYLHAAPYEQGRYLKNDEYFLREIGGYLLILFGL